MKITFHLEAQLRTATGIADKSLEVPTGCTLLHGMSQLAEELGGLGHSHLLAGTGQVRPSLLIVVNGESVYSEEAPEYVLVDNSEILLMPPIGGG